MIRVNAILLGGLGGEYYSAGLNPLARDLGKVPGVDYVVVGSYRDWRQQVQMIGRFRDPNVLIGHSYGATAVLGIARALSGKKRFPLIVTLDPSQWWRWAWTLWGSGGNNVVGSVEQVLNFYQTGGVIGRQLLYRDDGGANGIHNILVESSHTEIDDDPAIHRQIIGAIRNVVTRG